MSTEPLELRFTVACSPAHAFETWAKRTSRWWPHGHSVSADPSLTATIKPKRGWAGLIPQFVEACAATV